jgi:hypothetical protein
MTEPRQQEHLNELVQKMRETMLSKGNDYAQVDRLSNFKLAGYICGLSPEQQCLSLIATIVARLGVLLSPGKQPNNESIHDSVLDLVCYSALLSMILEDKALLALANPS